MPMALGVLAAFLVMSDTWIPAAEGSFRHILAFEAAVFAVCGLLSCALVPERLLFATLSMLAGVIVGGVLNVVLYPTVNGFERNLFPLEIAFHTTVAVPSVLVAAAVWRASSHLIKRRASAGHVDENGDA